MILVLATLPACVNLTVPDEVARCRDNAAACEGADAGTAPAGDGSILARDVAPEAGVPAADRPADSPPPVDAPGQMVGPDAAPDAPPADAPEDLPRGEPGPEASLPPDAPITPGLGTPCTGGAQCSSGFCVDGVCCNTACDGFCQACNLPGQAGVCTPVPAGEDPGNECAADEPGTCQRDGTCDGRGGCRLHVAGTACGAARCTGASFTPAPTCDGAGTCQTPAASACGGYVCGPDGSCLTACMADGDCAAPHFCAAGVCTAPRPAGAACAGARECASGFCEQGVCCATACTGACRSCALAGMAGTCALVPAGQDPLDQCADQGTASCGTDGTCDGNGGCRLYAAGTVCAGQSCTNNVHTTARTCDGMGTCRPGMQTQCEPYACSAPDGGCRKRCRNPGDCAAGALCVSGDCVKKAIGATCSAAGECASGFCAQGVCCSSACTGTCQSCALAGTVGTCTNVPAGQDPLEQCADQGAASCGTDGVCDGGGACRLYASGTQCAAQSCTGSTETSARTCDGMGTCRPATTRSCAPYACGASGCLASCSGAGDCVSPNVCTNGSCGPKPNGTACASGTECASGVCAQGVCCATACTGTCRACNLAGSAGTCTNVPDGQDPLDQCADQGAASCGNDGFCNGSGACRKYRSGTVCAAPTCTNNTETSAGTCDGSGTCRPGTQRACSPYVCGTSGTCLTSCSSSGDCQAPNACNGTSCGLKSNGTPCAAGSECASGVCAQGVCCATACSGTCKSCNLPNAAGTCANVPNGEDPLNQCADQGAASCGTDGFCNGSGACRLYASGTPCAAAMCSGTTYTAARSCNGGGSCQGPAPADCGKYQCTTSGCRTSCGSNADCVSPSICSGGACGGLKGEYFDNMDFTAWKLTRTDATVDFDWGSSSTAGVGSPHSSIGPDTFSARWTGKVTPRYSETYTFYTISDDGVRLWVNNVQVINNWTDHAATENSGTIALTAGQAYDIRLEFYENGGHAVIKLSWSSPSQPKQIIPTSALTPAP